jgi:transposase-like protein
MADFMTANQASSARPEAESFWTEFLRALAGHALSWVKLVVSDVP